MKASTNAGHLQAWWIIPLAIAVLAGITIFLAGDGTYSPSGRATGSSPFASVSIISQSECMVHEDTGTEPTSDVVFQMGPMSPDGNWYSYNGSYGGIHAGYDLGITSDNITQTFTLKNRGTAAIDITITSSDFDNALKNDSHYIDVTQINGSFQIYLPGVGWRNVPDNNDEDEDKTKEITELCVADNLLINESIKGIDFQLYIPPTLQLDNYTAEITFTSYETTKINPCSGAGIYTIP